MDIKLLKSDIISNQIPNLLIFVAREPTLAKQYIVKMSETLNKAFHYYDKADSALYDITTNLKDDYLFVVYNDENVLKNEKYIEEFSKSNRNVVICFSDLDSSSVFYREHKSHIVVFDKLDRMSLLAYLQRLCSDNKITISQDKLLTIVDYCNCNLGEIMNEMDKIFILKQDKSDLLTDYMLSNGFSDYRSCEMFDIVGRILNKDMSVFKDINRLKESPVTVIYTTYMQARNRLLKTPSSFYRTIMKECYKLYNGIVSGTFGQEYSLKYLLYKVARYS